MKTAFLFMAVAMVTGTVAGTRPAAAQAGTWNGVWTGQSSDGRATSVTIAGGKVTKWLNNGFGRTVKRSSVGAGRVTIEDNFGWTATMTPSGAGSALLEASGKGQNGSPARNSSSLTKN